MCIIIAVDVCVSLSRRRFGRDSFFSCLGQGEVSLFTRAPPNKAAAAECGERNFSRGPLLKELIYRTYVFACEHWACLNEE